MYLADKGYNPLHFAAHNNNFKAIKLLCENVLKYGTGQPLQNHKQTLVEWINTKSQCDESFAPLHFASFSGNIMMIEYLI